MSFSKDVKEELIKRTGNARHCRIAELTALTLYLAQWETKEEGLCLVYRTETAAAKEQIVQLTEKLFHMSCLVKTAKSGRQVIYTIQTAAGEASQRMSETLKLEPKIKIEENIPDKMLLKRDCCKRAFIRGTFLAVGSITNPQKSYHFELVFSLRIQAEFLREVLKDFDVDGRIVTRKRAIVVYVKEGSQISDLLNIMEAHVALMELENIRILKDVRNFVNRQVNCETANINKTVTAAAKQIEDIIYIRNTCGLEELKDELKEIAYLRLEYPESSLKELGMLLSIGKSGVNHRLTKLCEIAAELREKNHDIV